MGEARRRKKLDPDFGSTHKVSKSTIIRLQQELQEKDTKIEELKEIIYKLQNNYEVIDDDFENEEDEYYLEDDMAIIQYEYEIKCLAEKFGSNEKIKLSREGYGESTIDNDITNTEDYLFSKAIESSLIHFYTFEIEKKGYEEMSNVTVTIKNLNFKQITKDEKDEEEEDENNKNPEQEIDTIKIQQIKDNKTKFSFRGKYAQKMIRKLL